MASTRPVHRDLFALKRAYAALRPPAQITFPGYLGFSTIHEFLLQSILLDPHLQQYPPSRQYQTVFWKWAIAHLESFDELKQNEDLEIDAQIFDHYTSLIVPLNPALPGPQAAPQPPSQSFLTHYWRTNHGEVGRYEAKSDVDIDSCKYRLVTAMESRTTIERGTTGLRTWLASFVLAHFLTLNPGLVIGKRVLELGSGAGFLGIVIASIQGLSPSPGALWLTDVEENVLNRCRENVQLKCNLSSFNANIQYTLLDWFDAIDPSRRSHVEELFDDRIRPDIILGADLVFDCSLIGPLVATLELLLEPNSHRIAMIALTVRNEDTLEKFHKSASNTLHIEELECDWHSAPSFEIWEDGTDVNKGVKIFKIYSTKISAEDHI